MYGVLRSPGRALYRIRGTWRAPSKRYYKKLRCRRRSKSERLLAARWLTLRMLAFAGTGRSLRCRCAPSAAVGRKAPCYSLDRHISTVLPLSCEAASLGLVGVANDDESYPVLGCDIPEGSDRVVGVRVDRLLPTTRVTDHLESINDHESCLRMSPQPFLYLCGLCNAFRPSLVLHEEQTTLCVWDHLMCFAQLRSAVVSRYAHSGQKKSSSASTIPSGSIGRAPKSNQARESHRPAVI